MYLKKLELYGFKSFANKTEFIFEPGVTAIVGPNGCGKTNVVESIKWALGEQSARSLRGSEMKDVIFSGTVNKEPVNFAEASLVFSNHTNILPIDYEEVTITRRLYRSGESEYLLNKTAVRLKDIAELLMGTGIGTDNYFIMEQGKIDQVLSSRPEERRAIFEEASGITKYKSKKKEALNKLESTEVNILRLNDIITEVQRQINSIERQAAKARRYQKHFQRLKELELEVCSLEYEALEKQRSKIDEEIRRLKQQQDAKAVEMESLSVQIKSQRLQLEQFDVVISDKKARHSLTENSIFRASGRVQLAQERIEELKAAIVDLTNQLELSAKESPQVKLQIEQLTAEKDAFYPENKEKENILKEKEDAIACLEKSIEDAQKTIAVAKQGVLDKAAKAARLKNESVKSAANMASVSSRLRRLELEKQNCLTSLRHSKEKLANIDEQLSLGAQKVRELEPDGSGQKKLPVEQSKLVLLEDIMERCKGFLDSAKAFLSDPDINVKAWYEDIYNVIADLIACLKNRSEVSSLIELANLQADKARIDEEFTRFKDELSVIESELDEISEESGHLKQEEDSCKAQSLNLEDELRGLDELINSNQNWIAANLKEKETALVEITRLKAEFSSLNKRKQNLEASLAVLVDAQQREDALSCGRLRQIEDSKIRITNLEDEVQRLSAEQETFINDKASIENELNSLVDSKKGLTAEISQRDLDYEKMQKSLLEINSSAHSLQSQAAQISFQEQRLKDRLSQTYKIDLGSYKLMVQHDAQIQEVPEPFDLDNARLQIEELKAKLDSIGHVNLDAVGEEKELQERFNFMVSQRDDLLKAKGSLLEAIAKINKTTKEMFVETFNKVQVEFRNFFKLLFGGGDTELFLLDESDVLESGIEIVARPPGKRLQNISLLSGGERAMTALALLFAIFKVKPSPFCLMDEMDAPLDEANIDRFSRVLQEFTKDSQFIIVTHNKRTISIADVMYGITMEESGISKVVSVKFSEKKEEAIAAV